LATACYLNAKLEAFYVSIIEFGDPDSGREKVVYEEANPRGQEELIKRRLSYSGCQKIAALLEGFFLQPLSERYFDKRSSR
jgi:hypothetical protein